MKSNRRRMAIAGLALGGLVLSGCAASAPAADGPVTLELQSAMVDDTAGYNALASLAEAFTEKNPNITIDVVPQTKDYEGDMKVRLASGDLPDLWATHGWSLLRYSEFLEPLGSQSWADRVNPVLKSTMYDADGEFYALPLTTDVSGILYNKTVLEGLGIDPASLNTIEAFNDALAATKAAGIVPISSSGKDSWFAGNVADFLGSGAFDQKQLDQLADGEFVDSGFTALYQTLEDWTKAGYFNPDFSAAVNDDIATALGSGTTAFVLTQNGFVPTAKEFVPDAELGFIPVPAINGGAEYLIGGEGYALGAARDGKNKAEALAFLDFLAEPENASVVATAYGNPSGLSDVEVDLGPLQPSFDEFFTPGTVQIVPYFDRAYLPNGMWNTLITTTDSLITGQGSVSSAVDLARADFTTLFGQQ